MNNVKDVKRIEASRGVCLDCERMMNANKVTTTTPKTGKRSKNRRDTLPAEKTPKMRKKKDGS